MGERRRVGAEGRTLLLAVALCGAATPIFIAVFARDRLWHEGVLGFVVAIACGFALASDENPTWQRRSGRGLLVLGGITLVVVIGLFILLLVAIGNNGFPQ
ncbi:MAG TPA: hypothetical protein VH914_07135 [Acidimicrobiia bacterium]|nr:hypothetical protein [Acidimicrobiia bacterium]